MQGSRVFPLTLILVALCFESFESASAGAPRLTWQRSALFAGLGEASALAFDPDTGRLAVGDEQGVWLSGGAAAAARVLRRGPASRPPPGATPVNSPAVSQVLNRRRLIDDLVMSSSLLRAEPLPTHNAKLHAARLH